MKKDKLYTVNKWNQPMFADKNLFYPGGEMNSYGWTPSQMEPTSSLAYKPLTLPTLQGYENYGPQDLIGTPKPQEPLKLTLSDSTIKDVNAQIQKGMQQPKPKKGLSDGTKMAMGVAGSAVGDFLSNIISDGYSAGTGFNGVMSGIRNVNTGNPLIDGIKNVATTAIQAIGNRGWGTKENKGNINTLEQNAAQAQTAGNTLAGSTTSSDFFSNSGMMTTGTGFGTTDLVKGGWFAKGKARKKGQKYLDKEANALAMQNQGMVTGANNVDSYMDDAVMSNFAALGGPINTENNNSMGALEYGLMSDFLNTKQRQAENKNNVGNLFAGMPGSMFALGGAQGTPNLVEENETVYNDYVYSNRIFADGGTLKKFHLPKKAKLTYADITKKLEKEIKERPNDPISQAAFKAQMEDLANEQERQKQEMEAERAREAFEALSPEEQVEVMQYAQQQEQAQQEAAMREQAMAEQQAAAQQQPSPEEMAMMQQQVQGQPTMGQPEVMEGQPMMAYGGKVNRFDEGGMKKKIYDLLGLKTQSDWNTWAKNNKLDDLSDFEDWDNILQNQAFVNAITKDNPALRHALENKYDFGLYSPETSGNVTFDDDRGNWDAQTVQGWWGSQDPAWLEVIKNHPEISKDTKLDKKTLENYLSSTEAFKKGTEWLQASPENRLTYLQAILNNPKAPVKARQYAEKYIDANGWKEGAARDYETIFNNPSGRAANPGTYWKTPIEAVRNSIANNYVINRDGTIEALEGDTNGLTLANTYQWADPQTDYTNNYYRRPGKEFHAVEGDDDYLEGTPDTWNGVGKETRRKTLPNGDTVIYHEAGKAGERNATGDYDVAPVLKAEWPRYTGLAAPIVGLGMQIAGVGKPDKSGLDYYLDLYNKYGAAMADYMPIGDYHRYTPMDVWASLNRMDANARAADRITMNSSLPLTTKYALTMGNNYTNQIAHGETYRQGLEYNDNKSLQAAQFNKDTNKFNAEAYNRAALQNAEAMNRQRQYGAQLGMQAAAQKADMDAGWYNGIYGNVAGLFKGISDLGKENAQHNMIAKMAADGIFGNMSDKQFTGQGFLKRVPKYTASEGGKIGKKKGKRGLTI